MARRNPTLTELRKHRVPAWWQDAKLGIFVHWTPASVPGFAPVDIEIGELLQSGGPTRWPGRRTPSGTRTRCASPTARSRATTASSTATGRTPSSPPTGRPGSTQWDPTTWAARFAATGARYVVLVTKHHDGYCLWPTDVANPHRPAGTARATSSASSAEAVRGAGMRFGVYYSGGLDWTFDDRPIGSLADMLAAIPRGDYPAYAEAQVRELIARYRPSVLWNDIAWPARGQAPLAAASRTTTSRCPTASSTTAGCRGTRCSARPRTRPVRGVDRRRRARGRRERDAGSSRRSRRTSTSAHPSTSVFPDVQRTPWECVRGMDQQLRLQRGVPARALPRARRAALVVRRHRRQGRQPAAQRRSARRRRADPRRAARPPRLARVVADGCAACHAAVGDVRRRRRALRRPRRHGVRDRAERNEK